MIYQTPHFKLPMPLDELCISHGSNKTNIMYSVAKWSDDDDIYACFIHNQNYQSEKYAEHFAVTHKGEVMMDTSSEDGIVRVSLIEALIKVSDHPLAAYDELYKKLEGLSDWQSEGMELFTLRAYHQSTVFFGSELFGNRQDRAQVVPEVFMSNNIKNVGLRCDVKIAVEEDEADFVELENIYDAVDIFGMWSTFPHIRVGFDHENIIKENDQPTLTVHLWLPLYSDKERAVQDYESKSAYIIDAANKLKIMASEMTDRLTISVPNSTSLMNFD